MNVTKYVRIRRTLRRYKLEMSAVTADISSSTDTQKHWCTEYSSVSIQWHWQLSAGDDLTRFPVTTDSNGNVGCDLHDFVYCTIPAPFLHHQFKVPYFSDKTLNVEGLVQTLHAWTRTDNIDCHECHVSGLISFIIYFYVVFLK